MDRLKALICAAAACLGAGGCMATAPRISRAALIERISGDAAMFNEAYGRAVNAQILLNILRSRDRQPRYYLATTGITDSPTFLYGDSVSVGSFPLGEQRAQPWGFGALGARREITSRPAYAVQPMDAKTLARAVFQPTPNNVFAHYWSSGWPRDLLLLLMVRRMSVAGAGPSQDFINEANDIRDDCRPGVDSVGCGYVGQIRALLAAIAGKRPAPLGGAGAAPVCGLIEAYDPPAPVRVGAEDDGACAPAFIVGAKTYRLQLRSFDDMVYYVGELMRAPYTHAQGAASAAMAAQVNISVAGLRGGGAGAPLFRIAPAASFAEGARYAAYVTYGGAGYAAGPPIGRSCADAALEGLCADEPAAGDRTSSVLSLLAEVLALNQSPESVAAPTRLILP